MNGPGVEVWGNAVGDGRPCCVVGEIGLNHNGDLGIAKKLVQVAAAAGCTAVKFQKRDVANLAIGAVLDAKDDRFPQFGSTYREVRSHLEFDERQYRELLTCAEDARVGFLCTPFDVRSVDFLEALEVRAYKLASHSLTNLPLLEYVAKLRKPTFLSTGMATLEEVDQAVDIFQSREVPLILMHCVSSYPQAIERSNLRLIQRYRDRYGLPVGYSGHEIGWLATLGAVALGACAVERHITLDNKMVGFDHKLSLMPDDLLQMVKDIRALESAFGSGEKTVLASEWVTRNKYHVSWVSRVDIGAGEIITEEMLTLKNPGTGIPAYKKGLIVGRKAKMNIPKDTLLNTEFLE